MTVDIENLEALAKNATPGPWWIDSHGMTMMSMAKLEVVFNHPAQGVAVRNEDTGNLSHWRNDWDASFIAAANPAAVLELIGIIKGLHAEVHRVKTCNHQQFGDAIRKNAELDQLKAELAGLKTGYEAYERVNSELRAENKRLKTKLETVRCLFGSAIPSDEELDIAIDAAMSREQSHD